MKSSEATVAFRPFFWPIFWDHQNQDWLRKVSSRSGKISGNYGKCQEETIGQYMIRKKLGRRTYHANICPSTSRPSVCHFGMQQPYTVEPLAPWISAGQIIEDQNHHPISWWVQKKKSESSTSFAIYSMYNIHIYNNNK